MHLSNNAAEEWWKWAGTTMCCIKRFWN